MPFCGILHVLALRSFSSSEKRNSEKDVMFQDEWRQVNGGVARSDSTFHQSERVIRGNE
jgi:hypothetical protein